MLNNLLLGANGAIAFCYFAIALLIFQGLIRGQQHLLHNPLVVATAAIFLTCALGHSAHILAMATEHSLPLLSLQVGIDSSTAIVAVTYLALRRHYSLLIDGPLLLAQTQNQLCQAHEKLTKININLESLVAERTQELLKINQQLTTEIAERQQAEAALRQQTEVLGQQAALIELSHDAIIVRDPNNIIVQWNRGATEIYGWTAESAKGNFSHRFLQTMLLTPDEDINTILYHQS